MMSLRCAGVLVAASLLGSCTWFKKKAPPPVVVAAPPPAPPADPAPATITSPPEIQPDRSTVATTPPPSIGTPAPPAKPPAQRTQAKKTAPSRRSGSRPSPTGSLPGPEDPEPATGPEPPVGTVPQLTEILTPSQQKRYNRSIDASLKRAEESLEKVKNRQLTADQSATAKRVQAFVRQAQDARTRDLGTARSLAQRAEILAADLARSVR